MFLSVSEHQRIVTCWEIVTEHIMVSTAKKTPMKMSVVQLYVRLGGWELLVVLSVNSKLQ